MKECSEIGLRHVRWLICKFNPLLVHQPESNFFYFSNTHFVIVKTEQRRVTMGRVANPSIKKALKENNVSIMCTTLLVYVTACNFI